MEKRNDFEKRLIIGAQRVGASFTKPFQLASVSVEV